MPPQTVDMFGPDGQVHEVQQSDMQAALQSGGELAHELQGPDGQIHYVRHSQLGDALRAGGVPVAAVHKPLATPQSVSMLTGNPTVAPPRPKTDADLSGIIQKQISNQPLSTSEQQLAGQQLGANTRSLATTYGNAGQLALGGGGLETSASVAKAALPSAVRAGKAFQDVAAAAKDVPVELKNSQNAILDLIDWQKKTQLGPTINKFLNRVTNPNLEQMTYGEARNFYSLLGRLSAEETSKLAPPVQRSLAQAVAGLKTDIGDAAAVVGKSDAYYAAMKEFSNAKTAQDIAAIAKKYGIRAAIGLAGGGLVGTGYHFANEAFRGR